MTTPRESADDVTDEMTDDMTDDTAGDARSELALEGGTPVRDSMLPYGRQCVDEDDVAAVVDTLRSAWLTGGPAVTAFEESFARTVNATYAVAVSSGTAALHCAMHGLGLRPGDEVIVPAMTFMATASTVVFEGATPVFADVDPGALLIDPDAAAALINERTRALVAVDYAGQPCDYGRLKDLCRAAGITLVADACHSLGATYMGASVGSLAPVNVFSLHPVKHITTGEGGVVATDDAAFAESVRRFRNHGMTNDASQRERKGSWVYEINEFGYNYRITDMQCALGSSQLKKLGRWVSRRRALADRYRAELAAIPGVEPLQVREGSSHSYHLFVVRLPAREWSVGKPVLHAALRAEGIGVNVHYIPAHLHRVVRERFGTGPGLCPVAEQAYEEIFSLPMFPSMSDGDLDDVIRALGKISRRYCIAT